MYLVRVVVIALLCGVMSGGCATSQPTATVQVAPTVPIPGPEEKWREIALSDDAQTLDSIDQRWQQALATLGPTTRKSAEAEGALLDPAAALDHPAPTPGSYKCRVVRLQMDERPARRLRAYPEFFCYIRAEGDQLTFLKQTGTDLPAGWLFPGGPRRIVFLGAQQDEPGEGKLGYGVERARDRAGVIERIGPFRWRLAMAVTGDAQRFDIYEFRPVPSDAQPEV
ncbi:MULTISPECIES: DUF4893 domain-containing protein [unclassified Sphingomonas]|jgi:hypothetical protein|uniref:DUF4893 domain-containing protein n=1 Tax=unclassified Sphingomonas TaxID=196159 RepID=UPI0008351304|nr:MULTISPECIES: DUF4893 domain-containing protein [unclassified Sphingomonas]MCH4894201.1 DUF4893 domain-containing protein [Sphingomonas sp. SFZ2018-12]